MNLSYKIAKLIIEKNLSIDDVIEALQAYNLTSLLPSILEQARRMNKDVSLRDTIQIEAPFPIGERALAHIKRVVGNDIAPHSITINKNILAGFKARFKEKLYDGSAERIIKQLTN